MRKSKLTRDLEKEGYENIRSLDDSKKYFHKKIIVFDVNRRERFAGQLIFFPKQGYLVIDAISGFRREIIWDRKTSKNRLGDFLFKL